MYTSSTARVIVPSRCFHRRCRSSSRSISRGNRSAAAAAAASATTEEPRLAPLLLLPAALRSLLPPGVLAALSLSFSFSLSAAAEAGRDAALAGLPNASAGLAAAVVVEECETPATATLRGPLRDRTGPLSLAAEALAPPADAREAAPAAAAAPARSADAAAAASTLLLCGVGVSEEWAEPAGCPRDAAVAVAEEAELALAPACAEAAPVLDEEAPPLASACFRVAELGAVLGLSADDEAPAAPPAAVATRWDPLPLPVDRPRRSADEEAGDCAPPLTADDGSADRFAESAEEDAALESGRLGLLATTVEAVEVATSPDSRSLAASGALAGLLGGVEAPAAGAVTSEETGWAGRGVASASGRAGWSAAFAGPASQQSAGGAQTSVKSWSPGPLKNPARCLVRLLSNAKAAMNSKEAIVNQRSRAVVVQLTRRNLESVHPTCRQAC